MANNLARRGALLHVLFSSNEKNQADLGICEMDGTAREGERAGKIMSQRNQRPNTLVTKLQLPDRHKVSTDARVGYGLLPSNAVSPIPSTPGMLSRPAGGSGPGRNRTGVDLAECHLRSCQTSLPPD